MSHLDTDVRRFSEEYLDRTRSGMWADDRSAFDPLDLERHRRILDVGCGTGSLGSVLTEETSGEVFGCDVDPTLLERSKHEHPVVRADGTRLPFPDGSADLVLCQALLINLRDPTAAVREFSRVSNDMVAAIEPDNGAVEIDSTVGDEAALDRSARRAYIEGIETDVTLGSDLAGVFERADVDPIETRRYEHVRKTNPPYDDTALADARRKASGTGLTAHRDTMESGSMTPSEFDALRSDWREMGRNVIEQMQSGEYSRTERIPFYVTVGRI